MNIKDPILLKKYHYIKHIVSEELDKYISESIGKHNDVPDDQFVPNELRIGIIIEREHTDSDEEAKSIAKDHLSEDKEYYTKLITYLEPDKKYLLKTSQK